jgi:hypothetical protein
LKFIKSIFIYFFAAIFIAVSIIGSVFAQQPVLRPDNASPDTTLRSASLKSDTVTKKINSKGSLTSKVTYGAVDSTIFDMKNNIVFLMNQKVGNQVKKIYHMMKIVLGKNHMNIQIDPLSMVRF